MSEMTSGNVLEFLTQVGPDRRLVVQYDGGVCYGFVREAWIDPFDGSVVLRLD